MKTPVYKTVTDLYNYMNRKMACPQGLAFLACCKTLDQAYACTREDFWLFAIKHDHDLLHVMPSEIKDAIDEWDWMRLTLYDSCIFDHIPSDIKRLWTLRDWERLTEYQPSLKEFSPFH